MVRELQEAKAKEIEALMKTIPGTVDVKADYQANLSTLRIEPRREALARYGMDAAQVLNLVTSMGGREVGQVLQGRARFPIIVRLPEVWRRDISRLEQLPVFTETGHSVPLNELAALPLDAHLSVLAQVAAESAREVGPRVRAPVAAEHQQLGVVHRGPRLPPLGAEQLVEGVARLGVGLERDRERQLADPARRQNLELRCGSGNGGRKASDCQEGGVVRQLRYYARHVLSRAQRDRDAGIRVARQINCRAIAAGEVRDADDDLIGRAAASHWQHRQDALHPSRRLNIGIDHAWRDRVNADSFPAHLAGESDRD